MGNIILKVAMIRRLIILLLIVGYVFAREYIAIIDFEGSVTLYKLTRGHLGLTPFDPLYNW